MVLNIITFFHCRTYPHKFWNSEQYPASVDWVPLMVNYFLLKDDDDTRFCFVPRTVHGNCPSNSKPSDFDFQRILYWKETGSAILRFSWSNMYIEISKSRKSWVLFLKFNASLLTQIIYLKVLYFRNCRFSVK